MSNKFMYIRSKNKLILLLKFSSISIIKNQSLNVNMRYAWHATYHCMIIALAILFLRVMKFLTKMINFLFDII